MTTETSTLIKFSAVSFRRIGSPYDDTGIKTYIAVINTKNIPLALSDWRGINLRDPKPSGITKKIRETLEDDPKSFFFRNRGITLIAEKVDFDNQSSIVQLEMVDKTRNGLLDGGHTFQVIREYVDQLNSEEEKSADDTPSFIKIEILEGLKDLQEVVDIVEARNTSAQVKQQSIQELLKKFEPIKNALAGNPYSERVAYKEHELLEDGSAKDIDIKDILSYLICFDAEGFDKNNHPIRAYSSKTSTVGYFVNDDNYYRLAKYIPLLPKILELRDHIYTTLPEAYNSVGGKFGRLTGVIAINSRPRLGKVKLQFSGEESDYSIPNGFIYPILAAFRSIVGCNGNKCSWKVDPIDFYDKLKTALSERVCEQAMEFRNPNKLGKDVATWRLCYDYVELEALRQKI